ncbi:peptidoglycan editing factor PgeF [Calothrix rhizosoleniae]|uniref:peptidoglycan editing factor PgeF n=1 Tax=Calothrix rhizosoleniae TaxID=888997 RepID=UPI000B499CA9|nr:peptidoglycan editing factor PgeF [Calothrix rhizosoleniae]
MHPWYWQNWQGLPYLTCSLLADWSHGFFTQHFWSRSPETELTQVLHTHASGYRLKQVHGNKVLTPAEISTQLQQAQQDTDNNSTWASADGLMSEQPLQALWVASADCTPVLIADTKTGNVAAVHAGWRGTAAKIVPQAIHKLLVGGSKLADLRIAMGPAIAGEVYQVSKKTAVEVGASILHHEDEEAMITALQGFPEPPVLSDEKPGHVRLDVRRVNYLQMEMMGISGEQIAIAPYCTYQTPEHFFSYRRDNLKKVQWSGIVSHEVNLKSS